MRLERHAEAEITTSACDNLGHHESKRRHQIAIALAFAAVYLIWGSTYLAIRVAIESLPPFLMAGVRFIISGTILYSWARWRGATAPTGRHWLAALATGALMFWAGNGGVVFAEQSLPSGLTALLVATVPVWVALADWLRPRGTRPTALATVGLVIGLVAVGWLAGPTLAIGPGAAAGAAALVLASVAWSVGTLIARHGPRPSSALVGASLQMLTGGVFLALTGLATGEVGRFAWADVTPQSLAAMAYLTFVGSLVGYSAYAWLVQVVRPMLVSTYAFVNPVVAVFLGWLLVGERLPVEALAAGGLVVVSVALVVIADRPR